MVSSIIYVVGENCWEMVAWRMKSMFLCIKMIHDKVLVSSFFFPHPPTSPLLPTLPPVFFFIHTDCSDICFLPRMCCFFCENNSLIPFRGSSVPLPSAHLVWVRLTPPPVSWVGHLPCLTGRSTGFLQLWGLTGNGLIRTNLWFFRNYWELVGYVWSFQELCCWHGDKATWVQSWHRREEHREVDTESSLETLDPLEAR